MDLKATIQAKIQEIDSRIQEMSAELRDIDDNEHCDEDRAEAEAEKNRSLIIIQNLKNQLEALRMREMEIANGNFTGICVVCDDPISDARLQLVPTANTCCAACQEILKESPVHASNHAIYKDHL
jgi:DnaK suppressor protein